MATVRQGFDTRDARLDELEDQMSKRNTVGGGDRLVKVRIPESNKIHLAYFSGDSSKDKTGFPTWRKNLDLHMDEIWDGLFEVLADVRKSETLITDEKFDELVSAHSKRPGNHDPEAWTKREVGRHLYKVLYGYTLMEGQVATEANSLVHEAKLRDGVEAYRLLSRHFHPFSYDVPNQMLQEILVVTRTQPKDADQVDVVLRELFRRIAEYETRWTA
jgi:hypothetical protein